MTHVCAQVVIAVCTHIAPGPTTAYSGGYFGQGVGAIILGGLACTGSETVLIECSRYSSIGATGCSHSQDAGVSCSTGLCLCMIVLTLYSMGSHCEIH